MKRALLSVSDKNGIIPFAKGLVDFGYELLSTGGTLSVLKEAGLPVTGVSDATGFPECLDGRVKTLHPAIHGGLLGIRDNPEHQKSMDQLSMQPIDILAVNLYPFKQTIEKPGVTLEEAVENIDIGGPAMVRAGAKNYPYVTVLTDPEDYETILAELSATGKISGETNFTMAAKAFSHTAHYDALIASYLNPMAGKDPFPKTITFTYEKAQNMRYGENSHQKAAFYKETGNLKGTLASAVQRHGKELSFNNINDTNGALSLLKEFTEPTVVACKHGNPCGVGCGKSLYEAYMKAYTADPISIYGGILVTNQTVDIKTAEEIHKIFIEIIVAPGFDEEAFALLSQKRSVRLLQLDHITCPYPPTSYDIKKVGGGLLVQEQDLLLMPKAGALTVTRRKPTEKEMEDLLFTWKLVKHVKSNGIAIGRDQQSVGIGPGQVNRIWACQQAIEHGINYLGANVVAGSVLASDAYFPFPDCVEEAHKAGITAIIQPGGSINDTQSIDACNEYKMAMVFTEMRHFKH